MHSVKCNFTFVYSDAEEFEVKRYWVDCLHDNKVHWRQKSSEGKKIMENRLKFDFFCFSLGAESVPR